MIDHITQLEQSRLYWAERASAGPAASLAWLLLDSAALYRRVLFLIGRSRKHSTPLELADELSKRKDRALIALGFAERCCGSKDASEFPEKVRDYPRLAKALQLSREHLRGHSFLERNAISVIGVTIGIAIVTRASFRPPPPHLNAFTIKATEAIVRDSMKAPDSNGRSRFIVRLVNELRTGINAQIAAIGATAQHIYFKHGDAPVSALFEALFQGKKRTAWSERIAHKQAELKEVQLALTDKLRSYYITLAGTEAAGGRSLEELLLLAQAGDMSLMQHRFDKGPWISKERLTHAELMVKDLLVSRTHLEVVLDELLLSTSLATDLAAAAPALVSIVLMSGPIFRALRYSVWGAYKGVSMLASLPSWAIASLDSFLRLSSGLGSSLTSSPFAPVSTTKRAFGGWIIGPVSTLGQWIKSSLRSKHSLIQSVESSFADIRRILTVAPSLHPFQLRFEEFSDSLLCNFENEIRQKSDMSIIHDSKSTSNSSSSLSLAFPDLCDRDIGLLSVAIDSTLRLLLSLYERGDIRFETLERLQFDLNRLLLLSLSLDDRRRLASEIRL